MTPPDLISLCCASLAAARNAEGETAAFYCATARCALSELEEKIRTVRLNLEAFEKELVRRGVRPVPKVGT